ncbi:transposase [Streptomyces goshikiensis]|uniref:transposase n=1 Tax=Streptomyces goshikiensis TaxID=1942 RepID=UPI003F4B67EB
MPERTPRRGGRRRDHRQVLDAIAFKYRTGRRGWTCPSTSVRRTGAHNRLRMWAADGAWEGVSPGPVKGSLAGEPADHDPRTVPQRADHHDPPRRGRPLPPAGVRAHARPRR